VGPEPRWATDAPYCLGCFNTDNTGGRVSSLDMTHLPYFGVGKGGEINGFNSSTVWIPG
jgi:hypothetical protein